MPSAERALGECSCYFIKCGGMGLVSENDSSEG